MQGRVALITGSSSSLGRATARRLATAGADLCLVDADSEALDASAESIRALGVKVHACATQMTMRESCVKAVAAAVSAFGRLDALCNIANVFRPSRTMGAAQDDWEQSLAVNLSAPFYLIQAALPHLLTTAGAVVSVLSPVVVLAHPYTAAYTASKAGLAQMMKSLAAEFIGERIRFNSVSFGGAAIAVNATASVPLDLDPKLFQRFSSVRAPIEVEEVAEVIAFLASDASSGFHGGCVTLDNGISLG